MEVSDKYSLAAIRDFSVGLAASAFWQPISDWLASNPVPGAHLAVPLIIGGSALLATIGLSRRQNGDSESDKKETEAELRVLREHSAETADAIEKLGVDLQLNFENTHIRFTEIERLLQRRDVSDEELRKFFANNESLFHSLENLLGKRLDELKSLAEKTRAQVSQIDVNVRQLLERPGIAVPAVALPPPRKDFVGREDEKRQFLDLLKSGQLHICGFHGQGGIGKTELAKVLGAAVVDKFPDGQFSIDLRGMDANPPTSRQVMEELLRVFGFEAKLPDDPNAVAGLYHGYLNPRRILIVLDNAADEKQVEPLLPPQSCAAIVTSRRYFLVQGIKPQVLDQLKFEDAVKLAMKDGVRLSRAQAEDLVRACGRLALAVRVAATNIAVRRTLPVADLIEAFRADRLRHLPEVQRALQASFDLLEPGLKALFPLLGVFPDTFDVIAADHVFHGEEKPDGRRARDVLDQLFQVAMMEFDPAVKRFRLHDLARDFASSLFSDSARTETQRRHAIWYRQVLKNAGDVLMSGSENYVRGLAIFDTERANIEHAWAWACANELRDDSAANLVCSMPSEGIYVLDLRQHARESIAWMERALATARRLGNREAEGVHLGNLGIAHWNLGDTRKAIEFYEQQLVIVREIGDRRGEGNALGNLGSAHATLGDARKAIEFYEQWLVIAREIGDRRGEGNALGNLGSAHATLGDARKAIEFYEQALVIQSEIGDRRGEGSSLGNLGNAHADLGDARKAIEFYEQALVIDREIGDRRGEGADLGNLGNAHADLGDARKAIEFYEQRLVIAREIGDRRGEGNALGNLGSAHKNLGDARKAIEFYEQALVIDREIGDRRGEGADLGNLGNAHADLGDARKAIEFYEQWLVIAREIGDRRGEGNALFNSAIALKKQGDFANAASRMEQAAGIFEAIENPDAARARALAAEYKAKAGGS